LIHVGEYLVVDLDRRFYKFGCCYLFSPFQETRKASNSLHSKVQEMTSGLTLLSLEVTELNDLRKKLSEEVQTFQYNVLSTLQRDIWTGMQKAVMSYVESEIAPSKQENAELLGEMNEMNQVWTHVLSFISFFK
jgi:FtsZ-binding cell division protein ZapB